MMRRTVSIPPRFSLPQIEAGLFARLPGKIRNLANGGQVYVITDSNVLRLYGRALHRSLVLEGARATILEVVPGETAKSARTLAALQTQLLVNGVDRRSLVLLLGGGVVGDVGGFAAATVLRGVRSVHVPTTLLAQVDSSIGGKVGINHPLGKNLIGAFSPPIAVLTDPLVLKTLPVREVRNGLAEVIKIAFACSPSFFRWFESRSGRLGGLDQRTLTGMIRNAAALKVDVVNRDPKDEGARRVLNFGHTIGHAIEAASGYRIHHGFAVSIGMVREASIAVHLGLMNQRECDRLRNLLRACRLPTKLPQGLSGAAIRRAVGYDKKRAGGTMHMPLPTRVGVMRPDVEVPYQILVDTGI